MFILIYNYQDLSNLFELSFWDLSREIIGSSSYWVIELMGYRVFVLARLNCYWRFGILQFQNNIVITLPVKESRGKVTKKFPELIKIFPSYQNSTRLFPEAKWEMFGGWIISIFFSLIIRTSLSVIKLNENRCWKTSIFDSLYKWSYIFFLRF